MPSKKPKESADRRPARLTRPPLSAFKKRMRFKNPESGELCERIGHRDSSPEEEDESYLGGSSAYSSVGNVRAKETQLPPREDRKSSKRSNASVARRHEQDPMGEYDFVEHAAQGSSVGSEVGNVKASAPPPQSSEDEDMPVVTRGSDFAGYAAEGFPKYAEVGSSRSPAPQWRVDESMIESRELLAQPSQAPITRRRQNYQKAESGEYYSAVSPPTTSSQNRRDRSQPHNTEMYSTLHDGTRSRRVMDKSQEAPYSSALIREAAERSPRRDQPPAVKKRPNTALDSKADYGRNKYQVPQRYPYTTGAASRYSPRHTRPTQQISRQSYCIEIAIALAHFKILKYIFLIVFLILLSFCPFYFFYTRSTEGSGFNVTDVIMDLKSEFPNQPRLSYRVIHSAIKNVALTEPKAPAIILLLAANGSETTCDRFAHQLANALSSPDHIAQISGKDYEAKDVSFAKKEIDDTISKTLRTDRMGAVLVEDLDHIPGDAALIFHTYCDHENAPFKRAVYVMTVSYGKIIHSDSGPKSWDKALQDHLYGAWADVGVDQVSPLLSRLTVSVAAITAPAV